VALNSQYVVMPALLSHYQDTTISRTATSCNADWYTWFGSCYAFSRGGIRVKLINYNFTGSGWKASLYNLKENFARGYDVVNNVIGTVDGAAQAILNSGPSYNEGLIPGPGDQFFGTLAEGAVEVTLPNYDRFMARGHSGFIGSSPDGSTGGRGFYPSDLTVKAQINAIVFSSSNMTTFQPMFARALAEDGTFYGFVSTPPVVANFSPIGSAV